MPPSRSRRGRGAELVRGPALLEDLADELASACSEGTLPAGLTVDQVWVQPDGRAILVDPLAVAEKPDGPEPAPEQDRALSLLRRAACLALEGGRRRVDEPPESIRSPVPLHASASLRRLLGGPNGFATASEFRADLEATRHLPTEVGTAQRATHLGILALLAGIPLEILYHLSRQYLKYGEISKIHFLEFEVDPTEPAWALFLGGCTLSPALWVVWDTLTRGGLALRLAGLGLVRWDGRPAPHWRCGWRSFLVWFPPSALLLASIWLQGRAPSPAWVRWVPFVLSLILMPTYAALALAFPSRGPHDYLAGTRVVPR